MEKYQRHTDYSVRAKSMLIVMGIDEKVIEKQSKVSITITLEREKEKGNAIFISAA